MEATIEHTVTRQRAPRRPPALPNAAPAPVIPRTYTQEAVEAMCGVSKRTLQRWRLSVGFPKTVKLGPGVDVYLADEVDAWLIKRLKR